MDLPVITPDGNKRLLSIPGLRGEIIDVYDLRDLPAAFMQALGPPPEPPPATCGFFEETSQQILTADDGNVAITIYVPVKSYNGGPDAMNTTLASEYATKATIYNARGQMLLAIVRASLPAMKGADE